MEKNEELMYEEKNEELMYEEEDGELMYVGEDGEELMRKLELEFLENEVREELEKLEKLAELAELAELEKLVELEKLGVTPLALGLLRKNNLAYNKELEIKAGDVKEFIQKTSEEFRSLGESDNQLLNENKSTKSPSASPRTEFKPSTPLIEEERSTNR